MTATQDTALRTRDNVGDELQQAISGAMSGLSVIKSLARASNGRNDVNDCDLEWLADKALEDVDAAFKLAEMFDKVTRPAPTPAQRRRIAEAVDELTRATEARARADLAEIEARRQQEGGEA